MINFFRKIRYNLMEQNKTGKYFKYAIGEIILVMVGILLALQVNNWNEKQKLKKVEIETLQELSSALKDSRHNLNIAIEEDENWISYTEIILDYLENRKPYTEDLDNYFGSYYFSSLPVFATSAYEQLKTRGLELISNKAIRTALSEIFEVQFNQIRITREMWNVPFITSAVYPIQFKLFKKHFTNYQEGGEDYAKPINYEALFENEEFKSVLLENKSHKMYKNYVKKQLIEKINELLVDIDLELDKLNN